MNKIILASLSVLLMIFSATCFADGCSGFSGSWFGSITNNGSQFDITTTNYYSAASHKAMVVSKNFTMSGTCENGHVDISSYNGAELSGNINASSGVIILKGHPGGSGGSLTLNIDKQS